MLNVLKKLVRWTGLSFLFYQWGWAGPLGQAVLWLTDSNERRRSRLLAQDFRKTAARWVPIFKKSASVPATKTVWVLSTMSAAWAYKLETILARGLEAQGYAVVIVWPFYERWRAHYHRLLGFHTFLDFQSVLAGEPPVSAVDEMVAYKKSISTKTLLKMAYRGVDVGRIVLSNILYHNKFTKLDLTGAAALADIERDLARVKRNVHAAEKMIAHRKPDLVLVVEKGVSPSAEIFGVCVASGVPVVQYANSQHIDSYAVKRYGMANRHLHTFSLSAESWEFAKKMPWRKEDEDELLREFEASYKGGRWFGRKFLHEGKRVKSPDAVKMELGLDLHKKTAVVFSHVLWDATFFFGEGLFENYETWLEQVVKAAYNNPSVNWVIKLHPDLAWKLKMENYTGELRDLLVIRSAAGGLPDHIKIVLPETDIDTFSFFEITDYCLTVRGTIGIEMACRGVPVLTAGTGRYSGLGFTVDSSSQDEYLERLARIQDIPPMAPTQTELARRFAFTLFKMRPWTLRSFKIGRMGMENATHPLSINIHPADELRNDVDFAAAVDVKSFSQWAASSDEDYRVSYQDRVEI